jgi:hypothetical protein
VCRPRQPFPDKLADEEVCLNNVDIILEAEGEGWIWVCANEMGRETVRSIFPDLPVEWTATPDMPRGYRAASLHIARMTRDSDVTKQLPEIVGAVSSIEDEVVRRFGALLTTAGAKVALSDGQELVGIIRVSSEQ